MSHILIVEDEKATTDLLVTALTVERHEVVTATNAADAVALINNELPDLVILDWKLPDQTGLSLASQWRTRHQNDELPLVMLNASINETELIQALDSGVDDYITKPFSSPELLARVRRLLRRKESKEADRIVKIGELRFDVVTRRMSGAETHTQVQVSPTVSRLLQFLVTNPERVHNRTMLIDRVWGADAPIDARTVDASVKRLREAMRLLQSSWMLETVRGAGYRLTSGLAGSPRGALANAA